MTTPPLRHFCTHFLTNYLVKGLTLYRSLERNCANFVLHIVCLDDSGYDILRRLDLPHARLIRRVDFENADLLSVKPTRSIAEYCWTCTPAVPKYVLEHSPDIEAINYLDADLFFYSSPEPIFEELGADSVMIVEHRFSPRFVEYVVNGKYNVQWLTFRRDDRGLAVLNWWYDRCIEWCFYKLEADRMGDQKYLDCWTTKFEGVHELQHIGGGVGPWNFANYRFSEQGGRLMVDDLPVIFFHFHSFRHLSDGTCIPVNQMYLQDGPFPESIWKPYLAGLERSLAEVRRVHPGFDQGLEQVEARTAPGEIATTAYWRVPESIRARCGCSCRARSARAC